MKQLKHLLIILLSVPLLVSGIKAQSLADTCRVHIQVQPSDAWIIVDDSTWVTNNVILLEKGSQHKLYVTEQHSQDSTSMFTVANDDRMEISINMKPGVSTLCFDGGDGVHYTISHTDQSKYKEPGYQDVKGTVASDPVKASAGPVKVKLTKLHHKSRSFKTSFWDDSLYHIDAHLRYLPLHYFGSVLVAKPSAMSDMAYGAEVGVVRRWGCYARYLATFGNKADGDDVDLNLYATELLPPYLSHKCDYREMTVGCAYRPVRCVTVKAGLGYGSRNSVWEGADGKTHNYKPDQQQGLLYDLGLMLDYKNVALTGGVSSLSGNMTGMFGVGIFW